jgi:hypothetical protein
MLFDAAIADAKPQAVTSWQGGDDGYDTPDEIASPYSGLRIKKIGRTTGLTTGIVSSKIAVAKPIPYKHKLFTATIWFAGIWAIVTENGDPFSLPGDSGSLVVTEGHPTSVGIVFAGGKGLSYMIPLTPLAEKMDFTLVSNHGV